MISVWMIGSPTVNRPRHAATLTTVKGIQTATVMPSCRPTFHLHDQQALIFLPHQIQNSPLPKKNSGNLSDNIRGVALADITTAINTLDHLLQYEHPQHQRETSLAVTRNWLMPRHLSGLALRLPSSSLRHL